MKQTAATADSPRRIHILPPETAKRIAAGEVIERPQSVLRELLDNSIDAGASVMHVDLRNGGLEQLQVSDNGCGMGREDLELSVIPHATSKISQLDDLLTLSSLGFRGEALASVAAVAELSIRSALRDDAAWELSCGAGRETVIAPARGNKGTSVTVKNLFASFPARRQFLQRPAAESLACRQTFIEKSLPFPNLAFHLSGDGKAVLDLLPGSLRDRVHRAALPQERPDQLQELTLHGSGFSGRLVAGVPTLHRKDRRFIQVFINNRRVQEYRLQQALEYSYREVLPGGMFPLVWAFLEVDPTLADFNIHPAKKEVRLRNIEDLRQALQKTIHAWLADSWRLSYHSSRPQTGLADPGLFDRTDQAIHPTPQVAPTGKAAGGYRATGDSGWPTQSGLARAAADYVPAVQEARNSGGGYSRQALDRAGADRAVEAPDSITAAGLRYFGQTLGTFLLFEYQDEIFLLDQHAAHERIIFDRLGERNIESQELLVPYVYDPASDQEDSLLESLREELRLLGFGLEREGSSWVLDRVPALLPANESATLFEVIRAGRLPADLLQAIRASIACKAAVKDGTPLDAAAARQLACDALGLREARCPHGRPIWVRISREQLFRMVGRIV